MQCKHLMNERSFCRYKNSKSKNIITYSNKLFVVIKYKYMKFQFGKAKCGKIV